MLHFVTPLSASTSDRFSYNFTRIDTFTAISRTASQIMYLTFAIFYVGRPVEKPFYTFSLIDGTKDILLLARGPFQMKLPVDAASGSVCVEIVLNFEQELLC